MIIVKNFFCHCRNIRPVERYRRSSASSFLTLQGFIEFFHVFYIAFNSISVISLQQFTLIMYILGFTSARLDLCSALPKDTHRIQCGLNQGALDNESNMLLLSYAGPQDSLRKEAFQKIFWIRRKCW